MPKPSRSMIAAYSDIMGRLKASTAQAPTQALDYISAADQFRRAGQAAWALDILLPLKRFFEGDPKFKFILALSYRDAQDMEGAYQAVTDAAGILPKHPDIAFAKAQFAFESWRPASAFFRQAQRLAPQNLAVTKNLALALISEGRSQKGVDLLERALKQNPDWVDGHRQLTSIKTTFGETNIGASFERACGQLPNNMELRLAWFYVLAQAKDWEAAARVLNDAPVSCRDDNTYQMAVIYHQAESGGQVSEAGLHGELANAADPGFDLCRVRYFLRNGKIKEAKSIAERHSDSPNSHLFLPYLSLCWRLLDDPKSDWLERGGAFIAEIDLGYSTKEMEDLGGTLRALHTLNKPYLEQSVKGGTQTDRNLFFNPDKSIQRLRSAVTDTVSTYVSNLPVSEQAHPFLDGKPDQVQYSGVWSVRLKEQGYHTTHTHVLGWLSSAIYIALPSADELGAPPAGYLSFGTPPPELGLTLEPYKQVQPKVGKLVLFPSYTWHGTVPFASGERLSVAFDVMPRT